jgi:putative protease
MQYNNDLFIPLAELNRARREFLTLAESALVAASCPSAEQVDLAQSRWRKMAADYPSTSPPFPPIRPTSPLHLAVYVDSLEGVCSAVESGCDRLYFEPDIHISTKLSCCSNSPHSGIEEQIKRAIEQCRDYDIPLVWKFPRITRTAWSDTILPLLPRISDWGIAGIVVENPGMIDAILTMAPHSAISGSVGLNVFNHATAKKLSSHLHLLTLSPELSRNECSFLVSAARKEGLDTSFALIVQGVSEVIISDDCLLEPQLRCKGDPEQQKEIFYGIRDVKGHIFPVHIDSECRSHIGNSAELCLVDYLPEIIDMGISEVVIDARGRPGAYVSEMTCIYRTALLATATRTTGAEKQLHALKDRIYGISSGEITRGHFIRGLKES